MKAVLFSHVLYLIFIKSFMVKGTTKCGSHIEMRAVLLSCPVRDNGCEENDLLSQTMAAEQEQLLRADGRSLDYLKEKRMNGFPNAVKDCKRKLVITMKVKNIGKIPCEDNYIVVDHVYDPITGGRGRLLSPLVVKLRQEQMVQLYGLQFQRVVNNDPYEEEISKGKFCSVSPDNPTCGITMYNGKPIPFSEGFCCSCSPHINAKRQLSPVSHGDSFIYRDSKLISQGHSHLTREPEPIFINPELVQLRSKKAYDFEKILKRLNSDKIPNYLLEADRKIVCDKGDFMRELCQLRQEKVSLVSERKEESESGNKKGLAEKTKLMKTPQPEAGNLEVPTVTTETTVPKSPKNRFSLRDEMEVLKAEPKPLPGTEFKGSRGKRENRYEMENNSLEENLERFIRTKKLYRNRRKRLLEISHRRNQNKKIRCSSDECLGPEFPDKDYVKPPPPAFFFSHDKLILNPLETTKTNATYKSPVESAYNGLKYALEQDRFNTKWDNNAKKTHQVYKENNEEKQVSFDLNNYEREKAHKYSVPDKSYGKDRRFKYQKQEVDRVGVKIPEGYFQNENEGWSNIRNYFTRKNKDYMNNNKPGELLEEEAKNLKDYNERSKELNEDKMNDGYEKGMERRDKLRNFKINNKNLPESQPSDKTEQSEYDNTREHEHDDQKFPQASQGKTLNLPSKSEDEAFDFNVEITHQNFPMVMKPRIEFKNNDEFQLNRPEIMPLLWQNKPSQVQKSKSRHYVFFDQNRFNLPQDIYSVQAENGDLGKENVKYQPNELNWTPVEPELRRMPQNYLKKPPNYFEPPFQYMNWPELRQRSYQPGYDRYRPQDHMEFAHKSKDAQEEPREQPVKEKVRERRSVKEFEIAKSYVASDANSKSNPASHDQDVCPAETVQKPAEVKPIDINAEILKGLPKLKEKMAKLDNKKTQRSTKTDLDRLIQSYVNAPDYILKQIKESREGIGGEEQKQNEARNSSCDKPSEGEYISETAHCMRFGDLWYSMYNIKKPIVAQIVGLQLFDKRTLRDGRTWWKDLTKGKMIRLGTFLSSAEDALPSVSLTFTGEGTGKFDSPIDPENYVLLVPSHLSESSRINSNPQLEGGPSEYLLVNKRDISLGGECNKIGTSFEAFARQPERCIHTRGSCLKRQPIDLWREDMEARIRGKRGKYFVENFGTVPNSPIKTFTNLSGEYLAMEYYGDYVSTIEVELKADHNLIVRKGRSNAQIPTVYIDGTYPKKTRIFMSVLNTGLTTSSFRPRLGDCPPDLNPSWRPLVGAPVTIPPQKRHDFKLDLSGALPANKFHATVQVLNQDNQPIAERKIRVKRGERCLCAFHCKCNCMGNPEEGKTCKQLSEEEYRAAGYMGSPPYRAGPFVSKGFMSNLRLVFITSSYVMLMFGIMKGILGAYFRTIGIAGVRIITGPRKLSHYYESELQCCTVLHDEFGFPIHPTTCQPVQIVPLFCEVIINFFFFFLYPIKGFWLILKSSVCLKIVFGECDSSRQDKDSDHKSCSPLLSQQNNCMSYNLTTITTKKCPTDEFLPYLPYRGDNDPLEEDDTEFVLQEMQKHNKK